MFPKKTSHRAAYTIYNNKYGFHKHNDDEISANSNTFKGVHCYNKHLPPPIINSVKLWCIIYKRKHIDNKYVNLIYSAKINVMKNLS